MCKVDCDVETAIAKRFQITKYPTLKISLNGDVMKREYRGQRSTDALVEFVREQLKDPIRIITHLNEIELLSAKRRSVVAYFDRHNTDEYHMFRRIAVNLREDCDFHAGFGDTVAQVHSGGWFYSEVKIYRNHKIFVSKFLLFS